MSSTSSGIVVSVPASVSSASGSAQTQWLAALSKRSDRLLSRPEGDRPCLEPEGLEFLVCSARFHDRKLLVLRPLGPLLHWVPHTRPQPQGCASVSPLGSVVIPGSESFSPSTDGVNASVVSSGGFSGAAGFTVLKLRVQS